MAGARFRNRGPTRCSIIRDSYGIAEENFVAPALSSADGRSPRPPNACRDSPPEGKDAEKKRMKKREDKHFQSNQETVAHGHRVAGRCSPRGGASRDAVV